MRRDTAAPHFEQVPFGESVRWRLTAFCELRFRGSCFEEFVVCLVLCWFFAGSWRLLASWENDATNRCRNLAKIIKSGLEQSKIMKNGAQIHENPWTMVVGCFVCPLVVQFGERLSARQFLESFFALNGRFQVPAAIFRPGPRCDGRAEVRVQPFCALAGLGAGALQI